MTIMEIAPARDIDQNAEMTFVWVTAYFGPQGLTTKANVLTGTLSSIRHEVAFTGHAVATIIGYIHPATGRDIVHIRRGTACPMAETRLAVELQGLRH